MRPVADAGQTFALKGKRVWVAGHAGMVGSALCRRLVAEDCDILTVPRKQLDLRRDGAVRQWLAEQKPDAIFLSAATVGGILVNSERPVDFLYDNLMIQTNVMSAAFEAGVDKLLFLGSSCIYPKLSMQPIVEEALLTGALESTNEAYAIAKIAGIKLCEAYRRQYGARFVSAMPTNLYGPNDNFDLRTSHVLPALLAKTHRAKVANLPTVEIWGPGTARREFLHVDDLADALVHLMKVHETDIAINVGSGVDVSILELALVIKRVVGFDGDLTHDRSKPEGTPQKLLDISRLSASGWHSAIQLEDGIRSTYDWFLSQPALASISG